MSRVRVAVSLSGGASLGAYQAGTMAALVVAVEAVRDRDADALSLDAMGGASAGALVALLAAAAHAAGLDPVETLHSSWVDQVDLRLLLDHDGPAPLGPTALRARLDDFVREATPVRDPSATEPIAMHVALSGLRGLTDHVDGLRGPGTIRASTYADRFRGALEPGLDPGTLFTPAGRSLGDAALASAANPAVFPARLVDRSDDRAAYEANGIIDLPDHAQLWFTDGGMMQTEPIGQVLDAAREVHGDVTGRRLALLVDPRSEGPTTARRFGDPDREPSWLGALSRALAILPAQVLYTDLRRVVRDDDRLADVERLAAVLGPALADAPDARRELAAFLDTRPEGREDPEPVDDPAELVAAALRRVAGLDRDHRIEVDVLSPLLLLDGADDDQDIESLLAGEIVGDLGGFLERDLRHSDFVLGYATCLAWLPDGLAALGVSSDDVAAAVEAVEQRHEHDWRSSTIGDVTVRDLPAAARLRLLEIALSAGLGLTWQAATGSSAAASVRDRLAQLRGAIDDLRG